MFTNYSGNGSVTSYLNATVKPWQVARKGNDAVLLGATQELLTALRLGGIRPCVMLKEGALFKMLAEELVARMGAADFGAEIRESSDQSRGGMESQPDGTVHFDEYAPPWNMQKGDRPCRT